MNPVKFLESSIWQPPTGYCMVAGSMDEYWWAVASKTEVTSLYLTLFEWVA